MLHSMGCPNICSRKSSNVSEFSFLLVQSCVGNETIQDQKRPIFFIILVLWTDFKALPKAVSFAYMERPGGFDV